MTSKVCLATVTTQSYLPGTLVTLGSFLQRHPRFDGDVVVIQDGLPEASRECLRALSDRVSFASISEALRERIAQVGAARPAFGAHLSHFQAFEAFRLRGYRKVFFCDSDLLFLRPVDELFSRSEALLCCGDWVQLSGGCRDAATFRPLQDPALAGVAGPLWRTFNDGFMLIDSALAEGAAYECLLTMLTPEAWRDTDTPHTKQFLQNRYFAGRQTLISSTYNFLLGAGGAVMRQRENLSVNDAKVLHFNLACKPWMPMAMLRWMQGERPVPAFKLWYDAWVDCLAAGHVRSAALLPRAEKFAAQSS